MGTAEKKKRGRPSLDRVPRTYSLDRSIALFIDAMEEGKRSQFVNECLKVQIKEGKEQHV